MDKDLVYTYNRLLFSHQKEWNNAIYPLQCRSPWFNSWVGMILWRRNILPTPVFLGFPGGSDSTESTWNAGDLGAIPGMGRSPGGGHGNPLQYSCLENPHGQRSLAGCSPCAHKESNMTELLKTQHTHSNPDGPRDYPAKWIKLGRERQIPYDITYVWDIKYDTNQHI